VSTLFAYALSEYYNELNFQFVLKLVILIKIKLFHSKEFIRHVWNAEEKPSSPSPSVCMHGTTHKPPGGFSLNLVFENINKICQAVLTFI
jgi:hypothetical protein